MHRLKPRKSEEARKTGIPKKTIEDTQYCVKVWKEWCSYHRETCGDTIPPLDSIEPSPLQHWLTHFVLEVRKKNGAEYSPNTLHYLCTEIMHFLRWNGCPFFTDAEFMDLHAVLDGEMKCLQAQEETSRASH